MKKEDITVLGTGDILIDREEPATIDGEVIQRQVFRRAAHQPHFHRAVCETGFLLDLTHRNRSFNDRDVGKDALVIVAQQSVIQEQATACAGRTLLSGLYAAHDDVVGTQVFDLLLGLIADAFSHRDQPDDGRDADQNTQYGQAGSQFV